MNKLSICLLSLASCGFINGAFAEDASKVQVPLTTPQSTTSNFTPAQLGEIETIIADFLAKNPNIIMDSFKTAMAQQQKEAVVKIEKAVAENKDKIFKNKEDPIGGNVKGSQSLVVFMDPYCGYCKKFHKELTTLLNMNKDVKIIFKDIPIMGESSILAIQALLAAKEQGKYDQLQNAVFVSDKPLTKKQLSKIAASLGMDKKKFYTDMKSKAVQTQIDQTLELAKALGINGTPTLIVRESKVLPGFVSAEDLDKQLKESVASGATKVANEKIS